MNEKIDTEQELLRALGQLRESIAPHRDLWPEIAPRLGAREAPAPARRSAWPWPALAASLLVAFAAGLMLGRQAPETAPMSGGDRAQPVLAVALEASEREYQAAFQTLTPVGLGDSVFGLQDADAIERSWADLHHAETALLKALQAHPDNRWLGQKLLDLRAQQLDLMKQLRMLDQNSRRNI